MKFKFIELFIIAMLALPVGDAFGASANPNVVKAKQEAEAKRMEARSPFDLIGWSTQQMQQVVTLSLVVLTPAIVALGFGAIPAPHGHTDATD